MKLQSFLKVGLCLGVFFPSLAQAVDVGTSFELIQALQLAGINPGDDVINLKPGEYSPGNVPFTYSGVGNGSLTLIGAGADQTILDGKSVAQVMSLGGGGGIEVRGMTFRNGKSAIANGGGLTVGATGSVSVADCVFQGNQSDQNAGALQAMSTNGAVVLQRNQFLQNTTTGSVGGALLSGGLAGPQAISVHNNVFQGNTAESGTGALFALAANGSIAITQSRFEGNDAGADAVDNFGAVDARAHQGLVFSANFLAKNQAGGSVGGAALLSDEGDLVVAENIVLQNTADLRWGGMDLFSVKKSVFFIANTVVGNRAGGMEGIGGVRIGSNTALRIYNNIVYGNLATPEAGRDLFVNDDANLDDIGAVVQSYANNYSFLETSCKSALGCNSKFLSGDNLNLDPLFVDAANLDVHLSAASPLIDQGVVAAPNLPVVDFEGKDRVSGSAPDLGALETIAGLVAVPVALDFGQVVAAQSSPDQIVTLRNDAADEVHVAEMILSDTENFDLDFQAGEKPCGSATPTVAGADFCTVGVSFQPKNFGEYPAQLTVVSDSANGNVFVSLRGEGIPLADGGAGSGGCGLLSGTASLPTGFGSMALMGMFFLGFLRYRKWR